MRLPVVVAQVLLVLSSFIYVSCSSSQYKNVPVKDNGLWAQGNYLREHFITSLPLQIKVEDKHFDELVQNVQKHNIKHLYVFWSAFESSGAIPDLDSGFKIKRFKKLKKLLPQTNIIPWVGGVQYKGIHLESSNWRANVNKSIFTLLQKLEVKHVHVNLEYVLYGSSLDSSVNYPQNYINLFKEFRQSYGDEIVISAPIASTSTMVTPFKYQHSYQEVLEISKYVNHISFLYYDTKLSSEEAYYRGLDEQLLHIKNLKKIYTNNKYSIGLGTFENGFPPARVYRDVNVEKLGSTLRYIKQHEHYKYVEGISIFCEWYTDKYEWQEFYDNWIAR